MNENERLVGTGGSNMFNNSNKSLPHNPYLKRDSPEQIDKQALLNTNGTGMNSISSFSVRIIFQNPETGKNAKVNLNISKDFTVNQLIHQALEQFNLQFKQQSIGVSLKIDDNYYDLSPLDCETHNAGHAMSKYDLVFGYTETGINNNDSSNNCKLFELSLKSRKAMEVNECDYRMGSSNSSGYRKHHSKSSSISNYMGNTTSRGCLGECCNSCFQALLCCCFYDMLMSMLSPATNMDYGGGNYEEALGDELYAYGNIDQDD